MRERETCFRNKAAPLLTGATCSRLSAPKADSGERRNLPAEAPMPRILAVLLLAPNLALLAQTDTPKPAYDFSLPREERIKLAQSAAPPEISGKATSICWNAVAT